MTTLNETENYKSDSELINGGENIENTLNQEANLTIKHESPKDQFSFKFSHLIDHDYCKYNTTDDDNNKIIKNRSFNSNEKILLNGQTCNSSTILMKNNIENLANTLKDKSEIMEPLEISIPNAFESINNKKQILILKNNDIVPVNIDQKSKILIDPMTIKKKINNFNNKSDDGKCKINEKTKLIKINPVNSILLTGNYSEPALRIVDPITNVIETQIIRSFDLRIGSKSDVNLQNNTKTIIKPKVILGKFKMNKEIYDGIMR